MIKCIRDRMVWVLVLLTGMSLAVSAQPDEWVVNPSAYQFTMSLTFTVSIDALVGADADAVAFFDESGACRGVGEASFLNNGTGWYTGLMLVYANQASGTSLSASIWDASEDVVLDSDDGLNFISDGSVGNFDAPIVFSAISDPSIGCMDAEACNYLPTATTDNGGCVYPQCADVLACNYVEGSVCPDLAMCEFPEAGLDCAGGCLQDADEDGICDGDEVQGCSDPVACNYDDAVTEDDCSCTYANYPLDCDGNCFLDTNGNGVCDGFEMLGCMQSEACNYNVAATSDDGSCTFCCFSLPSSDGYALDVESDLDSLTGLTRYRIFVVTANPGDRVLQVGGTGSATLIQSTTSFFQHPLGGALASAITPENVLADPSLLMDSWGTIGLDQAASQEGELNAIAEGSSIWSTLFEFGEDLYLGGGGNDGWSVSPEAVNALAGSELRVLIGQWTTEGDLSGQISLAILPFDTSEPVNLVLSFTGPQCGCTNSLACNYDSNANWDDGTCVLVVPGYDCEGQCMQDDDGDGVCDADEITGCVSSEAFNYEPAATQDDGSCLFVGCTYPDAINFDSGASIDDQTCLFEVMDLIACPDLNGNGIVGTGDLLLFLSAFGLSCSL